MELKVRIRGNTSRESNESEERTMLDVCKVFLHACQGLLYTCK